jgi:photosystem II stability/assembly factor-like uncharacterized protein
MKLLNKTELPQITLLSPILSLVGDGKGGVWAGGIGGVAHFAPDTGWTPLISGLPLTGVSALSTTDNWLFAGGVEGLSRTPIDSIGWQLARIEGKGKSITAIAVSPDFAQDNTILAATLEGGILRTEDAGVIWRSANFGLQNFEIICLVWQGQQVLAGTTYGLYRSPNGGRAWRLVDETMSISFAALIALPDDKLLAATDDGVLLHSDESWTEWKSNLPDDVVITALGSIGVNGLLLGTSNAGLWHSIDKGRKWKQVANEPIFCIQSSEKIHYAGTATGLIGSLDNGKTWEHLVLAPLHDLRRIQLLNGKITVSGGFSVTLQYDAHEWQPLPNVPLPLSLLTHNRQGRLLASGADGLFISDDGKNWQQVLSSAQGRISHITFRDNGHGWAFSADSSRILRTNDAGITWEIAASPLGTDNVVALESSPDLVFVATYNPLQQTARLWYSTDDGNKWLRGAEAKTTWSIVATYHNPPMIALGNTILAQQDDKWQAAQLPADKDFGIRRILGQGGLLLVLTTKGFLVSRDNAHSFDWLEGVDLPVDQMMDFAVDESQMVVLSVDGRVCAFELPA